MFTKILKTDQTKLMQSVLPALETVSDSMFQCRLLKTLRNMFYQTQRLKQPIWVNSKATLLNIITELIIFNIHYCATTKDCIAVV